MRARGKVAVLTMARRERVACASARRWGRGRPRCGWPSSGGVCVSDQVGAGSSTKGRWAESGWVVGESSPRTPKERIDIVTCAPRLNIKPPSNPSPGLCVAVGIPGGGRRRDFQRVWEGPGVGGPELSIPGQIPHSSGGGRPRLSMLLRGILRLRPDLRAAPRSRVRTCVRTCASRVRTCVRFCVARILRPPPPSAPFGSPLSRIGVWANGTKLASTRRRGLAPGSITRPTHPRPRREFQPVLRSSGFRPGWPVLRRRWTRSIALP